jgi:hypothetical protein
MTTAAWSTVIDQSSDAAFRTWGSELSGKFAAVGMVQTADTGQINWSTATRAAVINTVAGYEIWKLSSGSLFFKIEYGTGNPQPTTPSLWITAGTGSNGSGTLTGQTSTRVQVGKTATGITSTSTLYQSYLCATASGFSLAWKLSSSSAGANAPRAYITCSQTVDSTGSPTSVGYQINVSTGSNTAMTTQSVATAAGVTGAQLASAANVFFIPNNNLNPPANSLDGAGNNQAFLWWHSILGTVPMTPLLHAASVLTSDLAVGVSASMTLIGSTPHTYLNCGVNIQNDAAASITSAGALGVLMLYE